MRHNKNKPFKCNKCSANFVSKGELVTHNRTHTGDHPFTCEACNSGFTTSSSLVKILSPFKVESEYEVTAKNVAVKKSQPKAKFHCILL